ncbi:zinc finger protein 436-like [Pomacea canaliculata]|uniref:zinc finger protein 436-like n=1 Tax=Pomacea canaliculata TaxID=400727 RepID=UPI000D735F28|nr:zinc finger protein 436-like [Pomacea canaliculata]
MVVLTWSCTRQTPRLRGPVRCQDCWRGRGNRLQRPTLWGSGSHPRVQPLTPCSSAPCRYRRPRRCGAGNQCRNCGKTYRQSQHMLRHRRQCEGTFQLQCGTCGEAVVSRQTAGTQCRNCGKTYRQSYNMLRHRRQCEGLLHLQCDLCVPFASVGSRCSHAARATQPPEVRGFGHWSRDRDTSRSRRGAGNQCRNCGKTYRQSHNMLRHRRQCEGTFHLQCAACGKRFFRRDSYMDHLHVHAAPHGRTGGY